MSCTLSECNEVPGHGENGNSKLVSVLNEAWLEDISRSLDYPLILIT
jgi:hypothetical protein